MIYGTGVDLISLDRIAKTYAKYQNTFAKKILTIKEYSQFELLHNEYRQLLKLNHDNKKEESSELSFKTNANQKAYEATKNKLVKFLAKKFAIKEATVKALGVGISNECSFQDIESSNNDKGKPILYFSNRVVQHFFKDKQNINHLSLSDHDNLIVAFVIIEVN